MTKITNLNRARKSRAREEKRAQADQNAAQFGRSKAERLLDASRNEKARKMLDQHELTEQEDDGFEAD
ncbi:MULTISPECIES: DUF4169 family protein [Halocynthiibacter]|uniref:DUF4169 family protein n=1 Tax=Halocynthiibacter halioticoli TaxID=2986804 RepID=A0AAE3LT64_9RHOB|nr:MULTISPECIES: DUF4169 family protein [Halocynthiibacter]MCV6824576.1 DUF4169 family protein [Halocynthiibacter halioticoli]MCW4057577.1 DUF4169 family protein [Halocynthiibacter sp. SDUM655004]MDE0589390.1 DUF4169 family protein [Halocynthiibacter sp. C4]